MGEVGVETERGQENAKKEAGVNGAGHGGEVDKREGEVPQSNSRRRDSKREEIFQPSL